MNTLSLMDLPQLVPPSLESLEERATKLLELTVARNRWIPGHIKTGLFTKQLEFLGYEGREALYGGAAGGGKSVALLCAGLQYVDAPGYSALILRRTFKQLAKADSILGKAKEWLMPLVKRGRLQWNGDEHKFTFPSGATLEFGHMEHEDSKHNYQGGSWQFVGVDEVTQFSPEMLAYPRTRQRRLINSPIPIRWRGGSNPGGVGHEHVKLRYVKDTEGRPISIPGRAFFPATLDDNPHIDREEYVKTLVESGIDPVTLSQLLKGDWDAYAGGRFQWPWFGKYFRRGDYAILRPTEGHPKYGQPDEIIKPHELPRFMTVDPAASSKKSADYTVISVWAVTPKSDLMWLDCIRFQKEVPDIVPEIQQAWIRYRPMFCGIEAVAANSAVLQLAQRAKDPAMIVTGLRPAVGGQIADKLTRATPAIAFAASGRIWTPLDNPSFPLDAVRSELTLFTGDDKVDAHDDIVDSVSMAVECHTSMPNYRVKGGPSVMGGATGR